MLGAIIGDIAGSIWVIKPSKTKNFELLTDIDTFTDDSVMTFAIAKSLLECKSDYSDLNEITVKNMQSLGRKYSDAGYGWRFLDWIFSSEPKPYNSYGNGAAMRVSPCGIVANSIEEVKFLSKKVSEKVSKVNVKNLLGQIITTIR